LARTFVATGVMFFRKPTIISHAFSKKKSGPINHKPTGKYEIGISPPIPQSPNPPIFQFSNPSILTLSTSG